MHQPDPPARQPIPLVPLRTRIVFYPDYTSTNAYQAQLYANLPPGWSAAPGTIRDALAQAAGGAERIVFHLHWPEPLFAGVTQSDQFRACAYTFLKRIQLLQARGGFLVWTLHNKLPHDRDLTEHHAWFNGELASLADMIHVHSEEAIDAVADAFELPRGKCVVVPHGSYLDVYPDTVTREAAREQLNLLPDAFVAAFLGQLRPYKGLESLLDAFRRARLADPALHLIVAGKPVFPTRAGFWRGLAWAIPGLRVVEGYLPDEDLQIYLRAADIVVLPYQDVLTSGSALLAASFGKPVIVPDLPTLRPIVEGGFAFTYDPADPDALFRLLVDLRQGDPQRLVAVGKNGQAFAEAHRWTKISQRFAEALESRVLASLASLSVKGKPVELVCAGAKVGEGAIGVAIVNYQSAAEVEQLIATLPSKAEGRPVKAFILDNSGGWEQARRLRRTVSSACIVRSEENLGYAAGNNVLLELMRAEGCRFAAIFNPDIRLKSGALDVLAAYSEEHLDALIAPAVLREDGNISFAGGFLRSADDMQIVHRGDGEPISQLSSAPYEADVLHGCAVFFPLALLKEIGPLPEDYFLYFEETDWCLRARQKGVPRIVVPTAYVVHTKRSHGATVPSLYYVYYLLRNALIFNARHGLSSQTAERRLRNTFVKGWRDKIASIKRSFLPIFDRCVATAFQDGHAGVIGRVDLGGRLDELVLDAEKQSAGFIEAVRGSALAGWIAERSAQDETSSWTPGEVWLIADGAPVASVKASIARPDVAGAGYAEGVGFTLDVPGDVLEGGVHRVEVWEAATGRRVASVQDGAIRSFSVHRDFADVHEAQPNVTAKIDGISRGVLLGWAFDRANPGRAVYVDIYVNGVREVSLLADVFREDLLRAGIGDGRHGFRIALPNRFFLDPSLVAAVNPGGAVPEEPLFERIIENGLSPNGYDPRFDAASFLRWAYTEDEIPAGLYGESHHVKAFLELNMLRFAARARGNATTPLVSIVMPAYNRAHVIEAAIRSVLAQSYQEYELLIVDDGSADGTSEVVEQLLSDLGDERIRFLRHGCNRGVSAARNTALRQARGEIISYLDSDNIWHPECLSIFVERMLASSGYVTAYAGQEIWEYLPHFQETELRGVRVCPFNRSKLENRNFIDLNVFVHRRECMDRYGLFREDMRRLVDWELILRYTADQPPLFLPVLLNKYIVNSDNNQISSIEDYQTNRRKVHKAHSIAAKRFEREFPGA